MTVKTAILVAVLIGLTWLNPLRLSAQQRAFPSVLLIMSDDQGWGDVHAHGNDVIHTPNMDHLAAAGVQFERFFVSPVCAPTRASLLTGRYDVRTGVSGVTGRQEVMRAEEVTLAEVLKSAGYATGCFGKWHNGEQYPNHPAGQGFDQFFGFCGGHWNNYFTPTLEHNGQTVQPDGYITDVITDAAIDFIKANADRPFLCYVPYNAPHTPWQVSDRWFAKYEGRGLNIATQSAYAMVENIDHNIGRMLATLQAEEIDRQTIVIFLTDNGPNGSRYNGQMRGAKGSVHEGGMRVPLFVRWPGTLKPKIVSQIAAHIDLLPTLADLCGVALPATRPRDGRSLAPLMRDQDPAPPWPDRKIMTYRRTGGNQVRGAVRTQQYRFVREKTDQLYDMVADPSQRHDISLSRPVVMRELQQAWEEFAAEIAPSIADRSPIPVGYTVAARVELPAVEAQLGDQVRFYNGQGWAHDWITDFDDSGDRVSWTLEVVEGGRYQVDLSFAGPASAAGTRLSTDVQGQQLDWAVESFDSPVTGRPERTVEKGVRWVREFRTATLGTVELSAGAAVLTLAVPQKIPGGLDVNAVRLTKQ
ncbi:MAG: sulfatase-like hydrolase/transferase [Fuerstiella sp.]